MKPIFRWVIGRNVLFQGYVVLHTAVRHAVEIYKRRFRWVICYNDFDECKVEFLKEIAREFDVELYRQSWDESPIQMAAPEWNFKMLKQHGYFSGSIWKLCPPRLNDKVYEIISDNDIVIVDALPEIDQFLESDKTMLASDVAPFYGRFNSHSKNSTRCFNSGLVGLPPNYDYSSKLVARWKDCMIYDMHYDDEQGLVSLTLTSDPYIFIPGSSLTLLQPLYFSEANFVDRTENMKTYDYIEHGSLLEQSKAFHFAGVNRWQTHRGWNYLKEKLNACYTPYIQAMEQQEKTNRTPRSISLI